MKRILIDRDDEIGMGLALRTAQAVFQEETINTLCKDAVPGMYWNLTGEGSNVNITLHYPADGTLILVLKKTHEL